MTADVTDCPISKTVTSGRADVCKTYNMHVVCAVVGCVVQAVSLAFF